MSLLPVNFTVAPVEYRLFDFEFEHIKERLVDDPIEIDGEIILHEVNGLRVFISWLMGKGSYFISLEKTDFFCPDAYTRNLDVSKSALWKDFIGEQTTARHRDNDKQVLEICSNTSRIYCCSYGDGHWDADIVHIGRTTPRFTMTGERRRKQ